MIRGLFVVSVLLSVVSWYTTFEAMALYLPIALVCAPGFAGGARVSAAFS